MTEQNLDPQEAIEEVVEPVEVPQEPVEPVEPDPPSEVETEARKYGWRPKEEYTNDPSGWVDAEKFMGFASTQNKVLRDTVREMQESTDKVIQQRVSGIEQMLKAQNERQLEDERRKYEQQIAFLKGKQREAVEMGDTDAYDRASQQMERMQQRPQSQQPETDPLVEQYKAANEWTKDPVMWAAAINAVGDNQAGLSVADQLRLAESEVRLRFPDKFQKPKPPTQKVDAGGIGVARSKAKGASDLPPEARKQGKEFVEEGIFKSIDDYAKRYWQELGE